jgi:membrane-bound serine protease (ClpP class)
LSPLRPAGVADIDGSRVDVVSDGEFIETGAAIEVTRVDGNRVVVRQRSNTRHGEPDE